MSRTERRARKVEQALATRIVYGDGDLAYVEHQGVVRETDLAKLFDLGDREVWIPKSWIKDEGGGMFAVPKRLAGKKGLTSWEDR